MDKNVQLDEYLLDRFYVPEQEALEVGEEQYSDTESFPTNFYEGTIETEDEEESYEA